MGMENQFAEIELFEGKSYSDLLKEIYDNSVEKRVQIKDLISSLTPLVEGIGDATLLVPLIKEYLEIGVKNDDQLVKLAQLVQRIESGKRATASSVDMWTDLQGLLEEDSELGKEVSRVEQESKEAIDAKA